MTHPTPAPTSGTGPGGITLTVPTGSGSSSSSADLYGLGVWGAQTVNPGDLPFLAGIIGQGKTTTGDAVVKAFLAAPADQVATVQHALYMAGYYPKTYIPKWGVIGPADRTAFGQAVTIAGQSGAPVTSVLEQGAEYGAEAGIAAAQASTTSQARTATVNLPNTTDLEALAIKAFQSALGHKASPKQAAAFAAAYRAMSAGVQRNANTDVYNAQVGTNPTPIQGDPTQLVHDAAGLGTPYTYHQGDSESAAEQGLRNAQPQGFSGQIGGLMTLGQSIAASSAAGSAQQGGLTQVTTESPVSPDVAAENYARNTHPKQAAANDVANTFQTFLGLLSGIGG
jgi:hypothetical protein